NEAGQIDSRAGNAITYQREPKVHAFQQRAGVHPILSHIGITARRLKAIEWLAHSGNPLVHLWSAIGVGAQRANRAHGPFKRPFYFRSISVPRIELRREEDRLQHLANVAVSLHKGLRNSFD